MSHDYDNQKDISEKDDCQKINVSSSSTLSEIYTLISCEAPFKSVKVGERGEGGGEGEGRGGGAV